MLLLHQTGSVKVGEVVRYTVTYSPSQDRVLPSPERLHVRIRNTSAIAMRAAFVHGPYTLSVSTYPSHFKPNEKFPNPRQYGVPEFEPMLKAGGSWECELVVPENIRQSASGAAAQGSFGKGPEHDGESASWVIEVSSQVIFSTSAAVGYEILVAREKTSLSLSTSLSVSGGQSQVPQPGKLVDHQQSIGAKDGHHPPQPKGIFSRAIKLKVEDTATLWNTPRLPGWDDAGEERLKTRGKADRPVESVVKTGDPETRKSGKLPRKKKKVHLVILTHGLHSNLGADMLFLKESIDAAAKQARVDAKARRAKEQESRGRQGRTNSTSSKEDATKDHPESLQTAEANNSASDGASDDDDEEVIVRGYSGNATKTERGIKYLGKRLARFVLSMTYPDQPFLPIGKGAGQGFSEGIGGLDDVHLSSELKPTHKHSTIQADTNPEHHKKHERPYTVTSISFAAHSLGGLVQTYAIAYIQKHSPDFFDRIKPINFIALASPFLGLSNENPLYIKFALDFGLVGRTGKDLGLTWRAPTIARSGWDAIVNNLGESAKKKAHGETQPESKPLLRILPTGPAHTALKKFRNRTVYSNVVNDGIVALRTSCLLFLDWQGLGRVDKARRDAGLVETVVGFGWAELTGTNTAHSRHKQLRGGDEDPTSSGATTPREAMREVPQPSSNAVIEDDKASLHSIPTPYAEDGPPQSTASSETTPHNPLSSFFNLFKSSEPPKPPETTQKQKKILRRGQTLKSDEWLDTPTSSSTSDVSAKTSPKSSSKPFRATAGHEMEDDPNGVMAPPTTTVFEAAGDLLNPKMPDIEYLIDPSKRPRTIFHDRVYHPADIPPPPLKKKTTTQLFRSKTFARSPSSTSQQTSGSGSSSPYPSINHGDTMDSTKDYDDTANTNPDKRPNEVVDGSNMRVEEKIARGYHRDLSWRKVLVKLEPDAHNNIFVRRMFANAYGWPVIKHLVDSHFSDSAVARMRTEDEFLGERALDMSRPPDEHGAETKTVSPSRVSLNKPNKPEATSGSTSSDSSEAGEALDKVSDLPNTHDGDASAAHSFHRPTPGIERADSVTWSDQDWVDSDIENESEADYPLDKPSDDTSKEADKGSRSPSWNWTEKIVGKSATATKSPTEGKGEDKVSVGESGSDGKQ